MSFQKSQDEEYLNLCLERMRKEVLIWVNQVLDILSLPPSKAINDIGCNVGQLYKGFVARDLSVDYMGYDIEPIYLEEAKKFFPRIKDKFQYLDISIDKPRMCEISIISATLEHIEEYQKALVNILSSTKEKIILRTLLGERTIKAMFKKDKAETSYYINQYSFLEIFDLFDKHNFKVNVIRDKHTDSMP